MTKQTTRAKVTTIKMGAIEFPGLRWEQDGEVKYGVAVSQLAEANLFRKTQASRYVKDALGDGFIFAVFSELCRRKVNVIGTEAATRYIAAAAIKGNKVAQKMLWELMGFPSHMFPQKTEAVKKKQSGVVYLMQAGGYVKIGVSKTAKQAQKRVHQVQTGNPLPIVLLATKRDEDPYREESRLHLKFSMHRREGEWFEDVPAIREEFGLNYG